AVTDDFGSVQKAEPSEVKKQLTALEEKFLSFEGGLDIPERQQMWPELASLNGQLAEGRGDAGLCWMNALWERDDSAVSRWAWEWFRVEGREVPGRNESG